MKDPYYLPVPPIFGLIPVQSPYGVIIGDHLSYRENSTAPADFAASRILHDLNARKNPRESLRQLQTACEIQGRSQACLVLGRIYEFGAYNQTQDHAKALKYYGRVNDTSVLSALSFFHRHASDLPGSIVEADATMSFVESALPAALQHEHGFLRPMSCPETSRLLFPIARAVTEMTMDLVSSSLNATQAAALETSSDPADLHKLAMYELSGPYPTTKTIETAKNRLERALGQGHQESAAPLAMLLRQSLDPGNVSRMLSVLSGAIRLRDPTALVVASGLYVIPEFDTLFNPAHAVSDIRTAATLGYAPAVHRLGEITYLGLWGVGRSNSKGFKLFSQAAALGYRPAILRAARLLLDGDGVVVDCPQAVSMLKRIIDAGPWTSFFDAYQAVGSRHAFTKMMDMNLTPAGWLEVDARSEATSQLLKVLGHLGEDPFASTKMKRVRAAQEGDGAALLWLTLRSPLSEAVGWLKRIELMPPAIAMLAIPLKWYLIACALIQYRGLNTNEASAVWDLLKPISTAGLVVATALCLILLIVLRINWAFR